MSRPIRPIPAPARAAPPAGVLERLALRRLRGLTGGDLTLVSGPRTRRFGQAGPDGLRATIAVHDPRAWRALVLGGTVGAGEAYAEGWWDADELPAALRIFARDEAGWSVEGPLARLGAPARRLLHALRRNTRRGSRRNIAAHYDLGEDFFALFLDASLTYSAGIFAGPEASLEEAQAAKLDRLCRKLALSPADHLLEVGSGWGSLAIHAADRYGCRVTTTTISRRQHAHARRRVAELGLGDRVEVLLRDYRDLEGTFTKAVSIEMIEAVGCTYYETFFRTLRRLLTPDGLLAVQAITVPDDQFERARRSVDYIKTHVFPGSDIPSVTALCGAAARASDLRLAHLEDITPHYARTLARWRERFLARIGEARALGLEDVFLRGWAFYLAYCEAGFAEGHVGDVQMLFARPGAQRDLPALS